MQVRPSVWVTRKVQVPEIDVNTSRTSPADVSSPLKKASLTGFHATAKHIAAKAVSPSSETMRTI